MVKDFNALFCVLQYILSLMASSYVILVFVGMVSLVEINPSFLKAKESEKLILMTFFISQAYAFDTTHINMVKGAVI